MKKGIQIDYGNLFELKCHLAAKAGFDCVSINFHNFREQLEEKKTIIAFNINRILSETGLECFQTHLPYTYTSAELPDEKFDFQVYDALEISGKIGAKWCVHHPKTAKNDNFSAEKAFAYNQEPIKRYIEAAEYYKTAIALENSPTHKPAEPVYTSDYKDLIKLCDSFGGKAGICWDFGHANMSDFDHAQAIREAGNRIKCVHIHNNFKNQDDHLLPDTGNIDWLSVMRAFGESTKDVPLVLEVKCRYEEEGLLESYAKHGLECLNFLERCF